MGIVEVSLIIIGEDFICLFCGLETNFGFFAIFDSDFVGMVR
jgi:hypothetical protein